MNLPEEKLRIILSHCQGQNALALFQSAQTMSKNYREKTKGHNPFVQTENDAWLYSAFRMPATFASVGSALEQMIALYQKTPATLLDVGAGTGAATLACHEIFPDIKTVCLEKETTMMTVGKTLTQNLPATWKQFDIVKENLKEHAELVISSYMLNELSESERKQTLKKLWNATDEILLIVEPGTQTDFKNMLSIRNEMLSLGANLIAPCPHAQTCPMAADGYCNFSVRIARTKMQMNLKDATVPYEDEKFTYLAFSKQKISPAKSRIIRHPIIKPKMISLTLCAQNGIRPITVTKAQKEAYHKAKKVGIGSPWDD